MVTKKKDYLAGIATLLPEGLDEGTLEKIADLVASKIEEQVKTQIGDLTIKVTSFIRGNIEKLKEHAIKELELENETFRNAQLFDTIRSIMAVEVTPDDEINSANVLASIGESQEQKINVLVSELDKLLKENTKLKTAAKILTDQNGQLKESVTSLDEQVKLVAAKGQTKKMSDKAIVVSEQNFKLSETAKKVEQKKTPTDNEWLTEGVLEANEKMKKAFQKG